MADVDQELVKAIAYRTVGLLLTVIGVISFLSGILINLRAPDCNPFTDDYGICQVTREIQTGQATSYVVAGLVLAFVGQVLTGVSRPEGAGRSTLPTVFMWMRPKAKPRHTEDDS